MNLAIKLFQIIQDKTSRFNFAIDQTHQRVLDGPSEVDRITLDGFFGTLGAGREIIALSELYLDNFAKPKDLAGYIRGNMEEVQSRIERQQGAIIDFLLRYR